MLIVYPSRESVTTMEDLPWLGFILFLAVLAGYFFYLKPRQIDTEELRQFRWQEVTRILDRLAEKRDLKPEFLLKIQEDPAAILDPNFKSVYPPELQLAYISWRDSPQPLDFLENGSPIDQLLAAWIPHNPWVLALLLVGLLPLLFVFEHLYSRAIVLTLLLLGPLLLTFARPYAPEAFWPNSIVTCMANLVLIGAIACFSAPRTWIEVRIVGWLIKGFTARFKIPVWIPLALLCLGFMLLTQSSVYPNLYKPGALLSLLLLGLSLALLLLVVPKKLDWTGNVPEMRFNQGIARAEVYFAQEEKDLARFELRKIEPFATTDAQLQCLAELAWKNEDNELALEIHKKWFSQVSQYNDFAKVHNVVETLYLRGFPFRPAQIYNFCELGIQAMQYSAIRTYLLGIASNPDLPESQIVKLLETVGSALLKSALSDPLYVVEIRDLLLKKAPNSPVLPDLQEYFNARINKPGALENYDNGKIIRELEIGIKEIGLKGIRIRPKDGNEQLVPWTAIRALFGASIGHKGPRGSLLIHFRRKLFACHFSHTDIDFEKCRLLDRNFASAWEEMLRHAPENFPAIQLEAFEMVKNEAEYQSQLMKFGTRYR